MPLPSIAGLAGEAGPMPDEDMDLDLDTELEQELPEGLVQAIGEFRSAESDEAAAEALMAAIRLAAL